MEAEAESGEAEGRGEKGDDQGGGPKARDSGHGFLRKSRHRSAQYGSPPQGVKARAPRDRASPRSPERCGLEYARSGACDLPLGAAPSKKRGAVTLVEVRPAERLGRAAAWAAAAALLSGLGLGLVASLGQPITLVLGPADREYTQGFLRDRKAGVAGRWAKAEARIDLPFRVRRPSRMLVHGGRPDQIAAPVELEQDGGPASIVEAGPQAADHVLDLLPARALGLSLRSHDTERNLSLLVSHLILLPGGPGAVVPQASVLVRTALGAAALLAIFLAAGFSGRRSLVASLALLAAPLCLVGVFDPFSALHLARPTSLVVPLLTAPVLLLPRERARRLVPVLAAALTLRCAVFHPRYDYKDVEIHRQVTRVAERQGAAELWTRMTDYQQRFDLGRASGGSGMVPFPYPPTFYTLAALVPLDDTEEAMKLVALIAQGLTVLLVMVLAARLVGPGGPEIAAGSLAALLPPDLLELLRASYPAILGHAVDLAVVAWLACRFSDLNSAKGTGMLALALAAAALTYNAAPVHFAVFLPVLFWAASLPPAIRGRLGLALAALGGGLLSLAYYGGYLRSTLARAMEGHTLARTQGQWAQPLEHLIAHTGTYTLVYVLVAIAGGFVALRRGWPRAESRVLLAWLLFPMIILIPVSLSPEPFRYFRQFYFAYPLFPLLAAAVGAGLRRATWLPLLAALVGWSAYETLLLSRTFFLTLPS